MTNTTNANVKRAQLTLIVAGREGKARICRMRPDIPSLKASQEEIDLATAYPGYTLRQAIMMIIADQCKKASDAFAKRGVPLNIDVYTLGQVAIKYFQFLPYIAGGKALDMEAIRSPYDTEQDFCAYADLTDMVTYVVKAGNTVHLSATGNAAYLELMLPEGVTVTDGEKLDFTDGVARDGIQVRGWSKCNRKGAVVIVRGAKNPRAYITKAENPEKPWRSLETLLKTIDGVWSKLPKSAVDKSEEEGSEEELYSA